MGVWLCDIETKKQSTQWKRPGKSIPKKAREFLSNVKGLLTVSSTAMTRCSMNSCHKVIRSIRKTTLKLCADCGKQFVRSAQNCGKINHGFCNMITHQLTHRCLCMSFGPKTKPYSCINHRIFPLPKTETAMKGKCFAAIEKIKEKSKQKLLAIPKIAFQKCLEDWKTRWDQCIISERSYFEGDKIVIDK